MKRLIFAALLILSIALPVVAADGVVHVQSTFNVKETADRMESILYSGIQIRQSKKANSVLLVEKDL